MVTSRGTGITSGLVRGYQEGGSVTNDEATQRRTLSDFQRESKSLLDNIYEPRPQRSRLRDASPALMQFFGSLAAGKSLQGGFGGALEILGQSLQDSAPAFQQVIRDRQDRQDADRIEQQRMDLQALEMAREDYKDYQDKFKPFEFSDKLLRYNEGTDSYDIIQEKPSELIEAVNINTGDTEFVSESVIRAELEEAEKNPEFQPKYVAQKKVTDIVEAYNTQNKRFEFISKEALEKSIEDNDGLYVPKAPDTSYVTVFDTQENKNVFLLESAFNASINSNENRYLPEKEGLDTFKEVYSESLGANIYVTQRQILIDNQNETKDYSAPKDDPVFKTYYDPIIKQNVLATDEDVAARLNDDNPKNNFQPKNVEQADTIITLKNKESGQNVLVSKNFALENMELFEPEDKTQSTKSAIDTQTDKLVFVTNQDIEDNPDRYKPAILGQSLTVDPDGKVVMKSTLVDEPTGPDATEQQKNAYYILDDLNARTEALLTEMEEVPEYYFGISGGFVDFYNKYITQLGLPFDERAAAIRNDINLLAQTILRQISQDSRFTNEDRQYIQEITGKEAMDKLQSYDQVLLSLQKTQLLLEDRLTETSGALGVKPSHSMSIEELYDSYNNFKLDNKMTVKEGTVRRNDLPTYNLEQVKRRLKAYHTDFYNALYNPDGSSKPQDEVNRNLEQLGFGQ
tara:strand:- start:1216 stop:3267 length:2052 start_codon:yes stop_codon:yes gene_type:complete